MDGRSGSGLSSTAQEWCLDFTDTVDWRTSKHPTDKMTGYDFLVTWSLEKSIIDQREASSLRKLSKDDPGVGIDVTRKARDLREAIYHIFSDVAHKRKVTQGDVEILNSTLSRGLEMSIVKPTSSGFEWTYRGSLPPDVMLFALAHSAANLLTSEDISRVKECANEEQGCGSLFLDSSKTQTRKWCSMESCGTKVKLRNYYMRHKLEAHRDTDSRPSG